MSEIFSSFIEMCEVTQSCPTLCDPVDCSLPGFSIHGIFQARILEWVAISFSIIEIKLSNKNHIYLRCVCMHAQSLHCVWLFVTPRTTAWQAALSMRFPRQKYWSRLLFPSPGDLPNTGTEPMSPAWRALAGGFFTIVLPKKPHI